MSRQTGLLLRGLRLVFRRIVSIYFRTIEVQGDVPDRSVGGRLFGANHMNGLVDPILVLTHAPCEVSPIAKSTLFDIPGLRFLLDAAGAVPIKRKKDDPNKDRSANDATFAKIADHLSAGGNVLIFPEGISHNEPHLLPLRSGAGEMVRAAVAKNAGAVTYQAVALEFDRRDSFRSRALVLYGPVRHVPDLPETEIAKHITQELTSDLSELLVEGSSWEDRELILRVAQLYANEQGQSEGLTSLNSVGRRVELARKMLAPDSTVLSATSAKVSAYYKHLEETHWNDGWVVKNIPGPPGSTWLWFFLLLPWGLLGISLFALPWHAIIFVSRRITKEADVASTYKLGLGLTVYPAYGLLLALATLFFRPWWAPIPTFFGIVVTAFVALSTLERWDVIVSHLRANKAALSDLKAERAQLMETLEEARVSLALGRSTV